MVTKETRHFLLKLEKPTISSTISHNFNLSSCNLSPERLNKMSKHVFKSYFSGFFTSSKTLSKANIEKYVFRKILNFQSVKTEIFEGLSKIRLGIFVNVPVTFDRNPSGVTWKPASSEISRLLKPKTQVRRNPGCEIRLTSAQSI